MTPAREHPTHRSASGGSDHDHDHGRGHAHGRDASARRLKITLALVVLYMFAEVAGGLISGSLALLADAGHMLSDAAALALALFAMRVARRPPTALKTFGYHRAEILAALANAATLLVIGVLVVLEAWERVREPPEVEGGLMIGIAAGGLLINLAGLAILHGGRDASLNVRGAWLHVLGDALGSVQAIAAGALIYFFGWSWADPVASVLIALLVAWSGWKLLRESIDVLMEGTPSHLDLDEVRAVMLAVDGVDSVHDLHVWTITSGLESLSAHVRMHDRPAAELLEELRTRLGSRCGIEHVTLQLEPPEFRDDCADGSCADPETSPGF